MNFGESPEIRAAVGRLVRTADIEVIPLKGADEKLSVVPPGTTVTITCSPKFGLDRTLQHVQSAAKAGYRVIPHIAARQVAGEAELRSIVGRLDEMGVTDLFVVGGDADDPAGEYTGAAELLEALAGIPHGITSIGIGCYPEGHPKIEDRVLFEALLRKQPYAQYMASQLCFDPEILVSWLTSARAAGVRLPLHIGLASPVNTRKLVELSMKIGIGSSLRYLTKQHGMIGNLLLGNSYRPESFLQEMGPALLSEELGVEAVHLFSFNQLSATVEWQQRIGDSSAPASTPA